MNRFTIGVALTAASWFALPASAAPAPIPARTSQGPITDALRLRGLLPRTGPLSATPAVMAADGSLELQRRVMVYVQKQVTEIVQRPGGRVEEVTRVVTEAVAQAATVRVIVKSCKFFVIGKDGKLEALDAGKATAALKTMTAVLTGESADVDPRTLELIKPGTLCVIHLPPDPTAPPPPLPDERPKN